jgi:outer membrane protein assembly factor BamB
MHGSSMTHSILSSLRILFVIISVCAVARGEDWPQYRGPKRDDISTEKGLLAEWPAAGPPLVWTYADAGVGYSGPAVVGNRLYTLGGRGQDEMLIALSTATVKDGAVSEAWSLRLGETFDFSSNKWSAGPSSTPTVDGDRVYALSGRGDLVCVEVSSGKELWRKYLPKDLEAQVNPIGGGPKNLGWGFTWSPLVDGDKLICVPGGPRGTVAALDKKTGELLWQSKEVTDQAAYTSPMLAEFGGVRQYVVLTNMGVIGVAAADGKVLWNFRRQPRYGTEVVNSPIIQGDLVYVTVGAGQGCDLLRIKKDGDAFEAEPVYANKNMTNHHANTLLKDGHVFGYSDGKGWICQNLESGEIIWSERRALRAGALTYADGRLYCYSEDDGTVVLAEPNTTGWKETGRFKIPQASKSRKPSGKIWTPPVIANGQLFLRDQELIFCFDVKAK